LLGTRCASARRSTARWSSPRRHRLDVTDALHAGSNEIEVTVTNTPANAHGSAQASGLLGPVVLRPRQELTVQLER
jgi:hypothetical protein